MEDMISRNTDLDSETMQKQNELVSLGPNASAILKQIDQSTIHIVRQLFTSPGSGIEFLTYALSYAEVKQMVLPGLVGERDVAVISMQNIRELAKKIHLGYDTTHKYVVVFCALNLLVKSRYEGRIQLLFPLKHYAPPPTTQALDKLIENSRPKVRQFAMRVKHRCILYGIIPDKDSERKEYSTRKHQLITQLHTILQDEQVAPAKREHLLQRISSEIISQMLISSPEDISIHKLTATVYRNPTLYGKSPSQQDNPPVEEKPIQVRPGKRKESYNIMDDDDIEGLTEAEVRAKRDFKAACLRMNSRREEEKKDFYEPSPGMAALMLRHGMKYVNGEKIYVDEQGNQISYVEARRNHDRRGAELRKESERIEAEKRQKYERIEAEKRQRYAMHKAEVMRDEQERAEAERKSAQESFSPGEKPAAARRPAGEKKSTSSKQKKSTPSKPEHLEALPPDKQAAEPPAKQPPVAEKSPEQPASEPVFLIDPARYSSHFFTTYVTLNVINFINNIYNNNVNDATLRKQLGTFLAEMLDGDPEKWRLHMRQVNSCGPEAITGALVYVFSRVYDQGGYTITNKAGLFTARCREYHENGVDYNVVLLVKSLKTMTFEEMIAFFKDKHQKQIEQQEKHAGGQKQTQQQQPQQSGPSAQSGSANQKSVFAAEPPQESNTILAKQGYKTVVKKYRYGRVQNKKKRQTD